MTTTAAAERVRQLEADPGNMPDAYRLSEMHETPIAVSVDRAILARAYLALVRPDDATPLDEAWLRSAGFVGEPFCLRTSEHDEIGIRICIDPSDNGGPRCWVQETEYVKHQSGMEMREIVNVTLKYPKTRGDVRALARVLEIPLTGEGQ